MSSWMEGNNKEMQQSNETKQKQSKAKAPTPMGRSNGHSPHPVHCHMGRVSIQSKTI